MDFLHGLDRLSDLDLSFTRISPDGLSHLDISALFSLTLGGAVTDMDLKSLSKAKVPHLQYLTLRLNDATKVDSVALLRLMRLQSQLHDVRFVRREGKPGQ